MKSRFPSVETADEDGLVAVGGTLSPEWLVDAYTHGIFPWPMNEDFPITWFSPDPRAILPLDSAHFSRRLLRTIRSKNWLYSIDKAFEDVIRGCAADREDHSGTWITSKMIDAYCEMHRLGYAHSFEVWEQDGEERKLIGSRCIFRLRASRVPPRVRAAGRTKTSVCSSLRAPPWSR